MPAYVPPHARKGENPAEGESEAPYTRDGKGGGKDGDRGGKGERKGGYDRGERSEKGGGRRGRFEESDNSPGDWRNRQDGRRNHHSEEKTELEVFGEKKTQSTAGIDFDKYDAIPVQVSGDNAEDFKPIQRFSEGKLCDGLFENLRRCGYDRPTPVQKWSIPIVVSGRDLMACAQTGSGKTCAFMVPCLESLLRSGPPESRRSGGRPTPAPCALVLAPTRELAQQIHLETLKFAYDTGIRACIVYGGADMREQRSDLDKGCDVLVATPGRLTDFCSRRSADVSLAYVQFFILDEADRMLDMGFEPQVRQIVEQFGMGSQSKNGYVQSMMFSATFAREVQKMAVDFLNSYVFITVGRVGSASELVTQEVVYAASVQEKIAYLERKLNEKMKEKGHLAIIFVETKKSADTLELELHQKNVNVTCIHGDRSQTERNDALHAFKTGANPVMVATDVAARGLDIPNVGLVVNFDMPKQIDDYVHRIGRTGRAGRSGHAVAFLNERCGYLPELGDLLKQAKQELPQWFENLCRSRPIGGKGGRRGGEPSFGGQDLRVQGDNLGKPATKAFAPRAAPAVVPEGEYGNTGAEDAW